MAPAALLQFNSQGKKYKQENTVKIFLGTTERDLRSLTQFKFGSVERALLAAGVIGGVAVLLLVAAYSQSFAGSLDSQSLSTQVKIALMHGRSRFKIPWIKTVLNRCKVFGGWSTIMHLKTSWQYLVTVSGRGHLIRKGQMVMESGEGTWRRIGAEIMPCSAGSLWFGDRGKTRGSGAGWISKMGSALYMAKEEKEFK